MSATREAMRARVYREMDEADLFDDEQIAYLVGRVVDLEYEADIIRGMVTILPERLAYLEETAGDAERAAQVSEDLLVRLRAAERLIRAQSDTIQAMREERRAERE